ncbi:hypothetical protein [Propionicimonas sp.]|uniref:hypothetical protein n=1 Tax=Propionicimonas sp. TaxID=1955623 RepID=UPI0025D52CEC|nr:hypothetical protein [Propionicimonas sp.]MCG2805516.1 hypothetical protein [Propionicimonas sp.]
MPRRPTDGGTPSRGAAIRRSGGTSDARAARARELHRKAVEADELAARLRAERDQLIRRLRAEDPQKWSYGALAAALGCSRELIALVAKRGEAS